MSIPPDIPRPFVVFISIMVLYLLAFVIWECWWEPRKKRKVEKEKKITGTMS